MNNSLLRYFTYWYSTLANGGEPLYVAIEDKAKYIFTKTVAREEGSISEGWKLAETVLEIFSRHRPVSC